MATIKDCKICKGVVSGWGSLMLSDSAGICQECMNLIRSLSKNTGPAEGLQKKIDHWDKKGREIEVAQAINLAQNHAIAFPTHAKLIERIKLLYPVYLELLIEAKGQLEKNNNS